MKKFEVQFSGLAYVNGAITVEADNEEEAERVARGEIFDEVVWTYAGISERHPPDTDCVDEVT